MPFLGELSALLTAVLWSASSLVFTAATLRVGSVRVNVTRLLLASSYLLLMILARGVNVSLSASQIEMLALSGIVGLAVGDSFLFKAFQHIGARLSMLVLSVAPALAAVLAFAFLGEEISPGGIFGMVLTLFGVMMVVLERGTSPKNPKKANWGGIFYAFLGALGQAVGLIFAKLAFDEGPVDGFVAALVRILGSLVLLLPVTVLTGRLAHTAQVLQKDRKTALLMVSGSFLGPFLGMSFSLIAVAHTEVGVAATIMGTVPIVMLPMVRVVYRETLSWRAIGGAVIAVAGVAILFLR
jgi:drug/metabolite transporter (DMT)-like permease